MVKVKICGITNLEDALASVESGADALGFNFYLRSPRYIAPELAADIIKQLPPFVLTVGVFVNGKYDTVVEVLESLRLNCLQFHGDEDAAYCGQFEGNMIKAFRVGQKLEHIRKYENLTGILIDSPHDGEYGGTGQAFDWNFIDEYHSLRKPIILSGGLNPDNVAQAIHRVKPYAVDACSQLEISPGKKDTARVELFIKRAKEVKTS